MRPKPSSSASRLWFPLSVCLLGVPVSLEAESPVRVRVGTAIRRAISSRPLRDARPPARPPANTGAPAQRTEPGVPRPSGRDDAIDVVAQRTPGPTALSELLQFDGANINDDFNLFGYGIGVTGPNGAVGPDHYFQAISIVFRIFDKSGNLLLGPLPTYSIWTGLGGIC